MDDEILRQVRRMRHDLHEIPEPALAEVRTKKYLMDHLSGLEGITVVDRGAWFYACYEGAASDKSAIAFRADFDAVEVSEGKARHLCGHDGHSSVLAGLALWLSLAKPAVTIYMIFQPAEETGKGAALCRELLDEAPIGEIYGFHNIPGYETGSVIILPGTFACASTGLEITFTGTPSHAAYPEAGHNPAAVMAQMILKKDEILAEPHDGLVLATVIGAEVGGSAYGVSAGSGVLRFTIRAEKEAEFRKLVERFTDEAANLCGGQGIECSVRKIEEFPATENHSSCVHRVQKAAARLGLKMVTPAEPMRWSEDFGYYLQKVPGAFFGIGSGTDCPQLHTADYEFPDDVSEYALSMFIQLLKRE